MTTNSDRVVDAIKAYIRDEIRAQTAQYVYAEYVGPEEVDSDLSIIKVGNQTHRFIPKRAGVDPVVGETVVVSGGGGQLQTMVGIHRGDVTKAKLDEDE